MMDAVAEREMADRQGGVEWRPIAGAASFCDQRLKATSTTQIERHATKSGLLFAGVFAAAGVGALVGAITNLAQGDGAGGAFLLVFAAVFVGAGTHLIVKERRRLAFDRESGRVVGADRPEWAELELAHVRALQLLKKHVSGRRGHFTAWELNLVMDDGKRVNVLSHGDWGTMSADAQMLSAFLGVQVLTGQAS
jgi:hypothetical protein